MKVNEELEKELERFTEPQKVVVREFLKALAKRTRLGSGKISNSKQVKIIAAWKEFDTDVIVDAFQTFMKMDTNEKQAEDYVGGIVKNKQAAKNKKRGIVNGSNRNTASKSNIPYGIKQDEGKRVQQLIADLGGVKNLQCDF